MSDALQTVTRLWSVAPMVPDLVNRLHSLKELHERGKYVPHHIHTCPSSHPHLSLITHTYPSSHTHTCPSSHPYLSLITHTCPSSPTPTPHHTHTYPTSHPYLSLITSNFPSSTYTSSHLHLFLTAAQFAGSVTYMASTQDEIDKQITSLQGLLNQVGVA